VKQEVEQNALEKPSIIGLFCIFAKR